MISFSFPFPFRSLPFGMNDPTSAVELELELEQLNLPKKQSKVSVTGPYIVFSSGRTVYSASSSYASTSQLNSSSLKRREHQDPGRKIEIDGRGHTRDSRTCYTLRIHLQITITKSLSCLSVSPLSPTSRKSKIGRDVPVDHMFPLDLDMLSYPFQNLVLGLSFQLI